MNERVNVVAIVPVYKTEAYLPKCLDSLVGQTMRELLIIVVNDGSPDNCQAIVEEYIRKYPGRITSFLKENQGIGPARNYGIERAMEIVGPERLDEVYLSFVDSDDWLEKKAFELFYKEARKRDADIVCADYRHLEGGKAHPGKGFWGTDIDDPYQRIMNTFDYAAWAKIFRLSLFREIRFPAIMYEDVVTVPLLFRKAPKAAYLPVPLYNYFRHQESTSQTVDVKKDAFAAMKILLDYAIAQRDEVILLYLQRCMEYLIKGKL